MNYDVLICGQRKIMEQCIENYGLAHEVTIKASQKLDTILNAQAKIGVKTCDSCENFIYEIEIGAFEKSASGIACCKEALSDSDRYEQILISHAPVTTSIEDTVEFVKDGFKNLKPPYWCPLKKEGDKR